jgi:recombination protein RecA
MLENGYLPKSATGRIEIDGKKYTKSQIVDLYRKQDLSTVVKAIKRIQASRVKEEVEEAEEA